MVNNNSIVKPELMSTQLLHPLPVGANNMFDAGIIIAQKDAISAISLNNLIGGTKRRKIRKKYNIYNGKRGLQTHRGYLGGGNKSKKRKKDLNAINLKLNVKENIEKLICTPYNLYV